MSEVREIVYRLDFRKRNAPDRGPARATVAVPRIARLIALAIHFDSIIRGGRMGSMTDIGRVGHVTRARMSQIMKLLDLAPDIQEHLLFSTFSGLNERSLRPIMRLIDWQPQRECFRRLMAELDCRHAR